MSRDIRSFFITSKAANSKPESSTKTRKRRVISSDEDETKHNSPKKRTKITKKSEKLHDLSDSNTEDNVSPKKKKTDIGSDKKSVKGDVPKKVNSLLDAFGSNPIKRDAAPKITKKLQKMEAEFHDEDDFEETLKQLDTSSLEEEHKLSNIDAECSKINRGEDKHSKHGNENKKESPTKLSLNIEKPSSSNITKNDNVVTKRKTSSTTSSEDASPATKHKDTSKKQKSKKLNIEITTEKSDTAEKPIDKYEERIEKKKQHLVLYQQYLNRGGARNPGSKSIPEGAENCLAGLSFLITGVLDSLEREEADELIKKYGGRILQQVSRKTDYVIVGDQPGPSKLSKADSFNIKKISEDDLLEMIRTRPAGKVTDVKQSRTKSVERKPHKMFDLEKSEVVKTETVPSTSVNENVKQSNRKEETTLLTQDIKSKSPKSKGMEDTTHSPNNKKNSLELQVTHCPGMEALVEKYRPKSMKQLIGQQGDKSNAVKLYNWVKNWQANQKGQTKAKKPSPWDKNDNGAFFKAALLSGPPGIGKTTTVQVVCKELDFDLLEFNASDTRSKKLLKEEVTEIMSNTTMKDYFMGSATSKVPTNKHVLLMDEVDGMAGNEDRGGLQELINMIKATDIPIICICNDRNHPKMRTLANYTYDLRFQKPRLEQIRGAMKSICYKEGIKIATEDLDRLIESTNQDIRQVINHLALFADKPGSQEKAERKHINKDLKLGPWDVVKKVFSTEEHKSMTIHDKSGLFFHDYSIAPLFVQENYLLVVPSAPRSEHLERVALSAESLALGDVVEASIRRNGTWSLLPVQACYSSVMPGTFMSGHIAGQINFPLWLGRNSRSNKFDRLRQEITAHARLTTGAGKEAINLDYLVHLRNAIIRPLVTKGVEGVEEAVNIMTQYHLLREDLDALIEISLWPGEQDPMQRVDSKVKAAFTRMYNKVAPAVPYAISSTGSKKKGAQASQDEGFVEDEEEVDNDSDENEDDLGADKMIKAKKSTASKKKEEPKTKDTEKATKRGRGRGRGK